ncbi:MAG TPA: hypothetical protein VIJ63_00995 [Roseiarcus sp.]
MPIGRIKNRSLRLSSPATSNKLILIIGGWSAEVEKSRIVAQASLPLAGSLAQNFAHCGSGDTRSTFDGGAGWPGAAWPGAAGTPGVVGLAGAWADAAPASPTLTARAAALARTSWNLINRPFELVNGIVLRFVLPIGARNWRWAEPPSDLMTQGAVNALRISVPLSTFEATFQ